MLLETGLGYKTMCKTVLALGTFDGMHLGHREVIGTTVKIAKQMGVKSAVWCFANLPKNGVRLSTLSEKAEIMKEMGVDIVVSPDFCDEIRHISPQDFFSRVIVGNMSAVHVVCGFNYTFGYKGAGDVGLLASLCRESGIGFTCVPAVTVDGEPVSSTRIRKLIMNNDKQKAEILLGKSDGGL